jgi:hypothetical protein
LNDRTGSEYTGLSYWEFYRWVRRAIADGRVHVNKEPGGEGTFTIVWKLTRLNETEQKSSIEMGGSGRTPADVVWKPNWRSQFSNFQFLFSGFRRSQPHGADFLRLNLVMVALPFYRFPARLVLK